MRLSRRTLLNGLLGGLAASQADRWIGIAAAQERTTLRVGLSAPNTTLDPHLLSNAPNNAVATHVFDALVANDFQSRSQPGLAASWKVLDDTHWEFALRPNALFSDGSPLTLEDIRVSIERATTIPSAASFRTYTRSIEPITAAQPRQIAHRNQDAGSAAAEFARPHSHHQREVQGRAERRVQRRTRLDRHGPLRASRSMSPDRGSFSCPIRITGERRRPGRR